MSTDGKRGSGTHDLKGKRVAIAPTLGAAILHPEVERTVRDAAEALAEDAGLRVVDVDVRLPELSFEWALAGLVGLRHMLGDRYPACADDLTPEIQFGLNVATSVFNLEAAARVEGQRQQFNETMAAIFEQVDFVMASTNPDVAFVAEGPLPTTIGDVDLAKEYGLEKALGNQGALDHPVQHPRQPGGVHPRGHVRRAARRAPGARPPPRGGAPARPRAASPSASAPGRWWLPTPPADRRRRRPLLNRTPVRSLSHPSARMGTWQISSTSSNPTTPTGSSTSARVRPVARASRRPARPCATRPRPRHPWRPEPA